MKKESQENSIPIIAPDASLLDALKSMDELDKKLLVVLADDLFLGLVSIGDIQRAIIQNRPLNSKLASILRKEIRIARPEDSFEDIKQMMLRYRMELCPVVDENKCLHKVYYWQDVFGQQVPEPKSKFNLPVVIMAGGFGARLKPLTNVLPKPLIPIGEKTIVERIFDNFGRFGCDSFYLTLNYKAELIKYYLKEQNIPYHLQYVLEEKPCGTAGSLSLLKGKINETFFVSNCDILIEQDYSEILEYHQANKNDITIVSVLKHYPIPYGTLETTVNGQLVGLQEKPELTVKINSGMYLLESNVLDEIPEDKFFHITHLIDAVMERGGRVGVFPVSEKSWKDIGVWNEYLKNNEG